MMTEGDPDTGARLRALADSLAEQIAAKRNPAIAQLRPTRRRANIAAGMAQDAERLERVHAVLVGLADEHEAGRVPACLWGIRNRAQVDALLNSDRARGPWSEADRDRLARAGIVGRFGYLEARVWADGYLRPKSAAQRAAERVAQLERELIGVPIDGFFPTPPSVCARMIELADLRDGQIVYDPSAGKGDILEAVRRHFRGSLTLLCAEIVPQLREILKAKGYEPAGDCFGVVNTADRIVMNPPFERSQDAEHIRWAFGQLRPGGRLVSVACGGLWSRQTAAAVEFRHWLEKVDAAEYDLPDGAFNGMDAFRRTGVRVKLVVIDN